jgi:aspartyl/asparaginyl-tRNA synthetase
VSGILEEDRDTALRFFERMIIHAMERIIKKNTDDLAALNIRLLEPKMPFPRFFRDEAVMRFGAAALEQKCAEEAGTQFYWILGLLRENYDLIYPYLKPDGTKFSLTEFSSRMIYNYDLCAQSFRTDTGKAGAAFEVLSGAVREWLYEPIVERLIDNKIITVRPRIANGCLENIEELDGYGPFLLATAQRDGAGKPLFPSTFGGGIGIERTLMALLNGSKIAKVDDTTLFGKNPDSHPIYLF